MEDLEDKVNELYTVVMGPLPHRNNGINGTLKQLRIDFDKAMEWAHDIWNNKRRTECLGLEQCKKLSDRIDAIEKGDSAMGVAKVNLTGVYVMSVIQLIGLIVVALIAQG